MAFLSQRRQFLQLAASAAVSSIVPAVASAGDIRAKRNILFIAVDDLRTSLGCYGDRYAKTPNIDCLAAKGTLFRHAYCQQAVCNPSRQSLMTGRRPDTLRVWDLKAHFRKTSPGVETLPEIFQKHGYFAQSFGKIYHDGAPMADPQSWSVAEQFQDTPKRDDYQLVRNHVERTAGKADVDEWVAARDDDYPDGKVAKAAAEALLSFEQTAPKQPFFLAVGMRKPHLPFTAPIKYWEMFKDLRPPVVGYPEIPQGAPEIALHQSVELRGYLSIPAEGRLSMDQIERLRRGYYAAMSYTDAQIGRVLEALKTSGKEKETLIVFWADHGWHLGEKGLWCKTTNYEHDTNVPLIIVDPSQPKPMVCECIVELIDLFPTLCHMCGVPAPTGLEGKTLVPHLRGHKASGDSIAFSQFPRPWFYKDNPEYMGYAVRSRTHRYVEWRRFKSQEVVARELYEMPAGRKDETTNLAERPDQMELVKKLSKLLPQGQG